MSKWRMSRAGIAVLSGMLMAALAVVPVAPAQAQPPTPALATISGVVTLDGAVRAGVEVCVEAVTGTQTRCTTTGVDGAYAITIAVPDGSAMVTVSAAAGPNGEWPGFRWGETKGMGGFLYPQAGHAIEHIDLPLHSYAQVSGTVVDGRGAPVAGALVNAGVRDIIAGRDGRFSGPAAMIGGFYDAPAFWRLAASAKGYVSQEVVVVSPTVPTGITIVLVKRLSSAQPTLLGAARVGKTLTVKPGVWRPSGVTFTYGWYRDGKLIAGAAKASYRLTRADRGHRIVAKVTGSLKGYADVTRETAPTKRVARA